MLIKKWNKSLLSVILILALMVSLLTPIAQAAQEAAELEAAEQAQWQAILDADLTDEREPNPSDATEGTPPDYSSNDSLNTDAGQDIQAHTSLEQDYEGTRFIVVYKDTAAKQRAGSRVSSRNGKRLSRLEDPKMDVLVYDEPVDKAQAEADLSADGVEVAYIQPDYEMTMASLDMEFPSDEPQNDWTDFYDNLSEAQVSSTGDGVVIALLDGGLDDTHPALQGKLHSEPWDFVNNDSSVNDAAWTYEQGHATHLVGILAGQGSGVQGVAPDAKVLPLKVFQGGIAYTSTILDAISYAEEKGAQIANCSWGSLYYNRALFEAMERSSMLFICASGNSTMDLNKHPVYPAAFGLPNVIAVSSVGSDGRHSRFSNYGSDVIDVAAPGEDISSAWIDGRVVQTSGSSQAAAMVSGQAALVLSQNDSLDAAQIKDRIVTSADEITGLRDKVKGGKRVNMAVSVSDDPANNTVLDIPDDREWPDVSPWGEPEEDGYEQYGADGTVTNKAAMLEPREGLGVVSIGDKIYAIGGQNGSTYYSTMEIYDTKTNEWTNGPSMNTARSYFGCTVANGKIYVFGGYNNGGYLNIVEIFDPNAGQSGQWTPGAAMSIGGVSFPMCDFTATAAPNTTGTGWDIYLIGGRDGANINSNKNTIYKYNVTNNSWTQVQANISMPRAGHVAVYYDGNIYVIGSYGYSEAFNTSSGVSVSTPFGMYGLTSGSAASSENQIYLSGGYEPAYPDRLSLQTHCIAIRYNSLANFKFINANIARAGLGSAVVEGKLYLIGGYNIRNNTRYALDDVECIDLGYKRKASLPVQIRNFTTAELNGKIYMIGGEVNTTGSWVRSKAVYVYETLTDVWTSSPITDLPNYYNTKSFAAVGAYGKLYIIGGQASATLNGSYAATDKVFEYDPRASQWTEKAAMDAPRSSVQAAFNNGLIYVTSSNTTIFKAFDPLANTWDNNYSALPQSSSVKLVSVDGSLYAVINKSIYKYLPSTNAWLLKHTSDTTIANDTMISVYQNFYVINFATTMLLMTLNRYDTQCDAIDQYQDMSLIGTGSFYGSCGANNRIYVFIGSGAYADGLIEYQPTITPWADRTASGLIDADTGGVINGRLYVTEATSYGTKQNKEYDPQTNTWNLFSLMPTIYSAVASAVLDGKLYVMGHSLGGSQNIVEAYDPETGKWDTTRAPLPYLAEDLAATAFETGINKKIYVFGGRNGSTVLNSVYEYDLSTNKWTLRPSMQIARYGAGAVTVGGKIYLIGGFDNTGKALNTVSVYDPVTNTWLQDKKPMPTARGWFGIAADDHIYVICGFDGYTTLSTVHEYDPAQDKWVSWPGPRCSLYGMVAAVLEDGIYTVGGIDNFKNRYDFTSFVPKQALHSDIIHFGTDEINPSGNLSRSYTDMSWSSPGFTVNIGRTYNSKDPRFNTMLGTGWTFGFQGFVDTSGNDVVVRLPNGGAQSFRENPDGSYTARDSRSTLTKDPVNGTYTLMTKDRYTYGFNAAGYMTSMSDRNGNKITITVDPTDGSVTQIKDTAGRDTEVHYDTSGLFKRIDYIKDPAGRYTYYEYDPLGQLIKVIGPDGSFTEYEYDLLWYLSSVKDNNGTVIEGFTYDFPQGETLPKLATSTDRFGNVTTYEYDIYEGTVKTTDSNNRTATTWFDKTLYPVRTLDAEGRETRTEYNLEGGVNRYGEPRMQQDRNGNATYYDRDSRGNVTRIVNPDGSTKKFEYDLNDNLVFEQDEEGKKTYYVYDANGNLTHMARPLDDLAPVYTPSSNQALYAVTQYTYYSSAETLAMCGRSILGLLKTETDPENGVTTYTYDSHGNMAALKKPGATLTWKYTYNTLGWLISEATPLETYHYKKTHFYYDKCGRLLKKVDPVGATERMVYNALGQLTQKITPNEYTASSDTTTFSPENIVNAVGGYSNQTHGYRYTYYPDGLLETETTPTIQIETTPPTQANYMTGYTYDDYGNVLTKTLPNSAVEEYTYDVLNRIKTMSFNDNVSSVLLEEYDYTILPGGQTEISKTVYLDNVQPDTTATTTTRYNYAGLPVRVTFPDGTYTQTKHNKNGTIKETVAAKDNVNAADISTFYTYDSLNRLTGIWTPVQKAAGQMQYRFTGFQYDKCGRTTHRFTGRALVSCGVVPDPDPEAAIYAYEKTIYKADGTVDEQTNSDGGKITYVYNPDGLKTDEYRYDTISTCDRTYYSYNENGLLSYLTQYVKNRHIEGQLVNDELSALTTTHTYDKNGNLKTVKNALNQTTTYFYDALNRLTKTQTPGIAEDGTTAITLTTSATYDWVGRPTSQTDERGNKTSFEYDKRGNLIKTIDPENGANYVHYRQYDRAGRLTAEVSPENYIANQPLSGMSRTEYEYDLMGRLVRKIEKYKDPFTNQWVETTVAAYQYDINGNVIKSLDAEGYAFGTGATVDAKIASGYGTIFTYDLAGQLVTTLDPESAFRNLPHTVSYEYDGLGNKSRETDAAGNATAYTYNDAGQVLTVTAEGAGSDVLLTNAYDKKGRLTSTTDANGNTTVMTYNAFDQVYTTVLPGDVNIPALTVTNLYDKLGRLVRTTDSTGKETLIAYDPQGSILSQTERKTDSTQSISVSFRYDACGNVKTEIDGCENNVTHTYDKLNRKLTDTIILIVLSQTTTYGYDKNGNLTSVKDWRGNTTQSQYDPLDRLIKVIDPNTVTVETLKYNRNGDQISSTDALNHTTHFAYDRNRRQVSVTDPLLHTSSVTYDDLGRADEKTDPNENVIKNIYDRFGQLKEVRDGSGKILSSYTYDLMGNMLTQTDGGENVTTYSYNARNLPQTRTDQAGLLESSKYYANGLLYQSTDRNGVTTTFSYDIHGRETSRTAGGQTVSRTYDNNGNLLTMTDSTGTTTRVYDALGRVTSKTEPNIGTSTFEYDITSSMPVGYWYEQSTDAKGNISSKVYDKAGRLNGVACAVTYAYYPNGALQKVTYPGGAYEEYAYYDDGQLKTLANRKQNGSYIDTYHYYYYDNGNMWKKLDGEGWTEYTYDHLNRLLTVTEPDGTVTAYTYDDAGNRKTESVTKSGQTVSVSYSYNEQNRLLLTETERPDGVFEYTDFYYDNNGNLLSRLKSSVSDDNHEPEELILDNSGEDYALYEYDVWNQMVVAETEGHKTVSKYNGDGLRVEKTTDGLTTRYSYEYSEVVLELDGNGNQVARNVRGLNLISRKTGNETVYFMYNGHGDVVNLTDGGNTVIATYYYDAFGSHKEASGPAASSNPYRYSGYAFDSETGLYYLKSRFYDPELARFLQEDSYYGDRADPLSLNLYTYGHNNPVRYWDPTGHYVSPTDQANLTPAQIAGLEKATKDWEAANARGDTAGMKAANDAANAIRASGGYSGGNNGGTITVNANTGKTVTVIVENDRAVTNNGTIGSLTVQNGVTATIVNNDSGVINILNNYGTITSIYNTGTIDTISNFGTTGKIGYIYNDSGTIGTINNTGNISTITNGGTIGSINNRVNGSIDNIYNKKTIGSILTGKNSITIDNSGVIGNIETGKGSTATINNNGGTIGGIIIGSNGTLNGNNRGPTGYLSSTKPTENWATNSSVPVPTFINGQGLPPIADIPVGSGNMSKNGCGILAIYNALLALGVSSNLYDIINYFVKKGFLVNGLVAGGLFGIDPEAIPGYFEDLGYRVTTAGYSDSSSFQKTIDANTVSIMLYWNDKNDLTKGMHYVAIQPTADGIRVYNRYSNSAEAYDFDNLNAYFAATGNKMQTTYLFGISSR